MNKLFQYIKTYSKQLRGLFPESLPTGMTEFDRWASSLASTYPLPTTDLDSVKFTLASMIMHLGPLANSKSKYYFVKAFRAAAAKQVAGATFQEIKVRQQEAMRAAQQKTAEATANTPGTASDGQPSQNTQT